MMASFVKCRKEHRAVFYLDNKVFASIIVNNHDSTYRSE